METVQVETNVHCEKCVEKLAPHFNESTEIDTWEFDLNDPGKLLTVTGNGVSETTIASLLDSEGYALANHVKRSEKAFWKDKEKWKRASFNTLNCLIGCSIGDFGMILFLQAYYPETSMTWQMILAIIAGLVTSILLETIILKIREGFDLTLGLKTAFGMSFISMIAMEIAMNTTDFVVTGGKAAFADPTYWIAFIMASIAGFIAPLPYNYYKLAKFDKTCHV